jgi:hypothetical protein
MWAVCFVLPVADSEAGKVIESTYIQMLYHSTILQGNVYNVYNDGQISSATVSALPLPTSLHSFIAALA